MLPKEKLKVAFLVLGFSVGFFGAFVMLAPHPKDEGRKPTRKDCLPMLQLPVRLKVTALGCSGSAALRFSAHTYSATNEGTVNKT